MLRLILFLVVAGALAWAAVWVASHPGTVVVQWLGQELVLNVGTAVVAVLVFAALVILLFELIRWLLGLPRRIRIARGRRRELRGYQELTSGLMAVAAGDLAGARAHHRQAERHLPQNGALLLLSAQTAQLEGKEEVAHLKFRRMLERRDTEFLGLRGLLAETMRTGNQEEALDLARRAYRRSPTTPWVLTTLFELLTRARKWEEALGLVNEMQSQGLLDDRQAKRRRGILHHVMAVREREREREQIDSALSHARRAVKFAPGFAPAAALAAELAMQQGRRRLALRVLEDCWRVEPHPEVARAYTQLDLNEPPAQRLQRVDTRLAPLNRTHLETLLLQAELALQAHQWDVARSRLEQALAEQPTARVYRLLADLERNGYGDNPKAQEWLAKASDAPVDRAWVCEDTGEVLPTWQPFSPSGRFDAVHWGTPPRVATLMGPEQAGYMLHREEPRREEEPPASPEAPAPAAEVQQPEQPKPVAATAPAAAS